MFFKFFFLTLLLFDFDFMSLLDEHVLFCFLNLIFFPGTENDRK